MMNEGQAYKLDTVSLRATDNLQKSWTMATKLAVLDRIEELRERLLKVSSNNELLEKLSDIEHQQWMEWSKSVAPEVSEERRKRWEKLWIPYADLSEEMKEEDRKYARKVLEAFKI